MHLTLWEVYSYICIFSSLFKTEYLFFHCLVHPTRILKFVIWKYQHLFDRKFNIQDHVKSGLFLVLVCRFSCKFYSIKVLKCMQIGKMRCLVQLQNSRSGKNCNVEHITWKIKETVFICIWIFCAMNNCQEILFRSLGQGIVYYGYHSVGWIY